MLRELFGSPKSRQPAPAQPKPAAPSPSPRPDSVLGANSRFEGTLKAEGNIRIEGTFIGDVTTPGRVVIGEQAKLEGDLVGDSVDVAGMVKGDIVARKVSVMRTGRVLGDLRLEKLMTEEGGFIQGLVTMEEKVDIAAHLPGTKEPEAAEEKAAEKKDAEKAEAEPEKVKVKVTARAGK